MSNHTKQINFKCPYCSAEYEIFVREVPYLMLLNCPHCKEQLSCFDGVVNKVTDEILIEIKNAKTYSDIKSTINKINQINYSKMNVIDFEISKDDIINLQIDLEQCDSFEDVMRIIDGKTNSK